MSTKIRNIIFVFICICVFSTAFIYIGADKMHILPSNLENSKDVNNNPYSYLEGAKLQTRPKLTTDNFIKGTFQSQCEKWLGAKVPKLGLSDAF